MARKKARKRFTVASEARRRAREMAGAPPAQRVVPDKRRKPLKHKNKLIEEELS
jgi:ribosomal protein L44E